MKILPLLLLSLIICNDFDFIEHPENIQVKKKTDIEKEEIIKNVKYRMDYIDKYDMEKLENFFGNFDNSRSLFIYMWLIFPYEKRMGMIRLIVNELSGSGKSNIVNSCMNYMFRGNDNELLTIFSKVDCFIAISISIDEYNK